MSTWSDLIFSVPDPTKVKFEFRLDIIFQDHSLEDRYPNCWLLVDDCLFACESMYLESDMSS
jgi:hypothetical protein